MLSLLVAALLALPVGAQTAVKDSGDIVVLRLSARSEKHVREGHFAGGRNSRGKSLFIAGADLPALLKVAQKSKPRRESNGRDKRVSDAGKMIGTDGRTGRLVRTYVVIAEPDGTVVTMYPGR